MSLATPSQAITKKKGLLAALGGVGLLVTGIVGATACCWAPALVLTLGLGSIIGSVFGALHGISWPLITIGAILILGGSFWHLRKRRAACDC